MTITEISPELRARAERHNAEFSAMCAPFNGLTAEQEHAALIWFIGWVGSAAMHGDEDAKDCFDGALEAARKVKP